MPIDNADGRATMKIPAARHVAGTALAVLLLAVPMVATGAPETTVSFSVADVAFSTRQGFDIVEVEGCHLAGEPGDPLLPCMAVNFVIPRDKVVATVKFEPQQKYRLKGHYHIYPAQPETSWAQTGFVGPDPEVYESANP
jgi:hypothetical protein